MSKKQKKKGKRKADRIVPIIIGIIIVVCCMIPVSSSLFGQTGYITEITSSERRAGELDDGELPNTYYWTVGYKFKTKSGEYETGSVQVKGDAVSSKSGLKVGSPVRYLEFAPRFNTPGEGGFDGSTIMYLLLIGFGVFMITLGVRKDKPSKTPARRSREYRASKTAQPVYGGGKKIMFCKNCGTELIANAKFCKNCGVSQPEIPLAEPDWDSFAYDDETALTNTEVDELYGIATEEEIEDEFDLINSGDEGPAYYRKVLAIVRWRRTNGK